MEIWIKIPQKLLMETKDLKTEYRLTWDQLFSHIIGITPRPKKIQDDYIPFFPDDKFRAIRFPVSNKTELKFNKFSNAFLSKWHALDYLIREEKNRNPLVNT